MRRLVILLAVLGLAAPALAEGCTLTTSETTVDALGMYYVDWDQCIGDTCHLTIWVYEESNGVPGLQRQDEVHDDTCGGAFRGDTIIF